MDRAWKMTANQINQSEMQRRWKRLTLLHGNMESSGLLQNIFDRFLLTQSPEFLKEENSDKTSEKNALANLLTSKLPV